MSKKTATGFSLIELLLVIVIVAVFSTLSLYSYRAFQQNLDMKQAASQLVSTFELARTLAVSNTANYRVTFNLDEKHLWIDGVDSAGTVLDEKRKVSGIISLPETVEIHEVVKNSSGPLFSGTIEVLFEPPGSADYVKILLIRRNDDTTSPANFTSILLYSATGKARVYPHAKK